MDRRKFGAMIGLAAAGPLSLATAEAEDSEDWQYLGAWDAIMTMFVESWGRAIQDDSSVEDDAFGLYGCSAVALAGYDALNKLSPPPEAKEHHRTSLEALAVVADAGESIRAAIESSSYRTAVEIGVDAATQAQDIMSRQWDESGSSAPTPTRVVPRPTTPPAEQPSSSSGVTMANFNRLREGMTYQEVVSILGSRGELISSSTIAGITTEMYMWEGNSLGANMNAMFQDGKLISKAQFGLD